MYHRSTMQSHQAQRQPCLWTEALQGKANFFFKVGLIFIIAIGLALLPAGQYCQIHFMWQDDIIGIAHFVAACLCTHQLALPWGTSI